MRIPPHMTTEVATERRAAAGARKVRQLTLVYQRGEIPEGRRWILRGGKLSLGRDPERCDIPLDDTKASREHAQLTYVKASDQYRVVDLGSRNGTFMDGRRVQSEPLANGSVVRVGDSLFVYAEADLPDGLALPEEQGAVALARMMAEAAADLAAPTTLPILIIGPTGAGKEVMARRVHEGSGRPGPLVAVNCATFARELIGSELFGHAAGAFSGAHSAREGLFVSANGGTLFLDEIAELPLDQQPALLRVLQEGRVRPVGSDREVPVDVRVVAATHQALDSLQKQERFRADLYSRLAGFEIDLPGLAQRREEVLALFARFLGLARPLTSEAAEALLLYGWPQNVRELKHAAERARLFAEHAERVELTALPSAVQGCLSDAFRSEAGAPPAPQDTSGPMLAADLEPPTREALTEMLAASGGNVAEIARATGKHRQQVYRWMKKYGLEVGQFRTEDMEEEG
ncbi:MAG: sigma 54-interacting transcriptional regulator [Myxococcales bacterium]|nr:sigma 54-interacting transcriptional regulator [Myxococcales bacterium]MCB9647400.1 sigma 54-interacting transcriptional regulator [Deltaproteobacteria bacterium]